jgi:hypothetical protein
LLRSGVHRRISQHREQNGIQRHGDYSRDPFQMPTSR